LDIDYSIGRSSIEHADMHIATADAGAERKQNLRLEIGFPSITTTEATMQPGQYIQVVLAPH